MSRHQNAATQTTAPTTLAHAIFADFSPWTVLEIHDTGFSRNNQVLAAISTSGEFYSASSVSLCSTPSLTLGDPSHSRSCVTKLDTSGHTVFAVQVGGALIDALLLDAMGNAYIAGLTDPTGAGFAPTAGAYESSPHAAPDGFACQLSYNDGHPLFCTFIDVGPLPNTMGLIANSAFTIDSSDDSYIAGNCAGDFRSLCIQKLNATGTAAEYLRSIPNVSFPDTPLSAGLLLDAQGNLFFALSSAGIVSFPQSPAIIKLDPAGKVIASTPNLGNAAPMALCLDPYGNPQVAL